MSATGKTWTGTAVLALVTASGLAGATEARATSCIPMLSFRGQQYLPGGPAREVRGTRLGTAQEPGCPLLASPGMPQPDPGSRAVPVYRIRDVHPLVALTTSDGPYLGAGFFPALPGHPLHGAIYRSGRRPIATRGLWCLRRGSLVGDVTGAIYNRIGLHVRAIDDDFTGALYPEADTAAVEVDSRTVMDVGRRVGLPYIAPGTRLRVHARLCREFDEPEIPYVVATRIRRLDSKRSG